MAAATVAGGFTVFLISCASNPGAVNVEASKTSHTGVFGFVPKVIQNFIPPGNFNRRTGQKMKPKYITIHSTANQARYPKSKVNTKQFTPELSHVLVNLLASHYIN